MCPYNSDMGPKMTARKSTLGAPPYVHNDRLPYLEAAEANLILRYGENVCLPPPVPPAHMPVAPSHPLVPPAHSCRLTSVAPHALMSLHSCRLSHPCLAHSPLHAPHTVKGGQ